MVCTSDFLNSHTTTAEIIALEIVHSAANLCRTPEICVNPPVVLIIVISPLLEAIDKKCLFFALHCVASKSRQATYCVE